MPTEDGDLVIGDRRIAIPEGVKTALRILNDNRLLVARIIDETITSSFLFDEWDDREDDDDDEPAECGIDQQALNMHVERTATDDGLTAFRGHEHGIDLQVDCPHDSEEYLETVGGMDDAKNLPEYDSEDRGDLGEEHIGPTLVNDRGLKLNETFHDAEETGTLDHGFDIVASDENGDEWYIIEAKFRSNSGSVSNTDRWFHTTEEDGRQMSDQWVDAKIDEMQRSDGEDIGSLASVLEEARIEGKVHTEVIVVQHDEQNHLTVTSTLPEINLDRVHLIKLERVDSD